MRLLRLPHFKYKKYVSTFLFLLSFCIIFTTLFLKYTSNGVDAEFFAEAATNFFYNAKFKPVTEAFLLPEAGYLPLLQRIIAFFVVTIFDASAKAPLIFQIIALSGIALFCSFINLDAYKNLIQSKTIRFLIGLSLAFFPNFEMFPFINFVYFGFAFLFLLSFYNFQNKSYLTTFSLGFIGFLVVASKALMLAIAPYYGLLLLYNFIKQKRKDFIVSLLVVLGAALQSGFCLYYLIQNRSIATTSVNEPRSLFEIISLTYNLYVGIILEDFMDFFYLFKSNEIVIVLVFLVATLAIPAYFYSIRKKKIAFGLLALQLTSLVSLLLFLGLAPKSMYPTIRLEQYVKPPFMRWYFISHQAFILFLFIAIANFRFRILQVILILLFLFSYPGYKLFIAEPDIYSNIFFSHSQWKIYEPLLKKEAFCIPVNPDPWTINHNCEESRTFKDNKVLALKMNRLEEEKVIQKVLAKDKKGNPIALNAMLSNSNYYQYLLVDKPARDVQFYFYDSKGNEFFPQKIKYYVATGNL